MNDKTETAYSWCIEIVKDINNAISRLRRIKVSLVDSDMIIVDVTSLQRNFKEFRNLHSICRHAISYSTRFLSSFTYDRM